MTDKLEGKMDTSKPSPSERKDGVSKPIAPPAKVGPPSPSDTKPGKPPVRSRDIKPSESPAPKSTVTEKAPSPAHCRKPFPWPILLVLATPLASAGLLAWLWHQEDLYTLGRTGWICLSVILPGFGVMTILGGVAQLRRRPILSSLALLLAVATILACVWGFRIATEANWLD